jgi:WD40 repeat protein
MRVADPRRFGLRVRRTRPDSIPRWGYNAFISYSHTANGAIAAVLHQSLERLARPILRRRALRVFRDQESLAANPDLWSTIQDALRRSHFLILLASPDAAGSGWVQREIEFWRRYREQETLFIAQTGGTIVWDSGSGDFDWEQTDALPQQLRGWFRAVPLWVKLPVLADPAAMGAAEQRAMRDAVTTLAAPMRGSDKDELDSEDLRLFRRSTGLRRVAVAGLVTLSLLFATTTVIAWRAQRGAVVERNRATVQGLMATARQLIAQSELARSTDSVTALRLALAAHRLRPDAETRAALARVLMRSRYVGSSDGHDDDILAVAPSPDGRHMVTTSTDGTAMVWDVANVSGPLRLSILTGHSGAVLGAAFGAHGHRLVTFGTDDFAIMWDITDAWVPRRLSVLRGQQGALTAAVFSGDGRRVVTISTDRTAVVWGVSDPSGPLHAMTLTDIRAMTASRDGRSVLLVGAEYDGPTTVLTITGTAPLGRTTSMRGVSGIDEAGGFVLAVGADGVAVLQELTFRLPPQRLTFSGARAASRAGFSPDGRSALVLDAGGVVTVWAVGDPHAPVRLGSLTQPQGAVSTFRFSPDSRTVLTLGGDGTAAMWDLSDGARPRQLATFAHPGGAVTAAAFSADGRRVLTGGSDGRVEAWDVMEPDGPAQLATLPGHRTAVVAVSVSPDGRRTMTIGEDGRQIMWDVSDVRQPRQVGTFEPADTGSAVRAAGISGNWRTTMLHRSSDLAASLWDTRDVDRPSVAGTLDRVWSFALTPDGNTALVVHTDHSTALWDVREPGAPVRYGSLPVGSDPRSVSASPDGRTALTVTTGHAVLWDIADPARPARLGSIAHGGGVSSAIFAGSGHRVVLLGETGVTVWDITNRDRPRAAATLPGRSGVDTAAAFGPDDRSLLLVGASGATTVWDLSNPLDPLNVATLGHTGGAIGTIVLRRDGRVAVSAGPDGVVAMWDVSRPLAIASNAPGLGCAIAARGLDRAEWARFIPDQPYRDTCAG